jgi:hypothetical protein
LQLFLQTEHRANFAILLHLPNHKSGERVLSVPAGFPVLKCPIGKQTVRAKQAGHFPLFNCPALTGTLK